MDFTQRYSALNERQKQAVDTIDGPVMVVAGPGTGKTELLSVRVANILKKTDSLPGSILCLTFTDSAATNMRQRLVGLMGKEGYKVAVQTFHSFGSEVINRHSQYFYHGAHFKPADELSSHEILSELLQKLPHDNPLASTMNGEFTYLGDIRQTISEMKRSGYTPDEITSILDRNDAFCDWIQPTINETFAQTVTKKIFPVVESLIQKNDEYTEETYDLIGYTPLRDHIRSSLSNALTSALENDSQKPITAWKKEFLYKNDKAQQALKDVQRSRKLRAATQLYYEYLVAMQDRSLYDYDDMILRVVHGMEVFDELRYELQESYQYIMVDEFQDTNEAQMRLLWNLTNHPSQEQSPNVLVVGDDDQAIYRFQGADMSNILDFNKLYSDVKVVTLTDNYRSTSAILKSAEHISGQISERLVHSLDSVDKTLTAHYKSNADSDPHIDTYGDESTARHNLAATITAAYKKDATRSRAIIARNHRHLLALLPHLQTAGVPLRYELQENCLDSEPMQQLEHVSRIVLLMAQGDYDQANALLPELLAHPAWGIKPAVLWQLGVDAHKRRTYWIEIMLEEDGRLQEIAEWLIVMAHMSQQLFLERMLDQLFGVVDQQGADVAQDDTLTSEQMVEEDFISPLRAYFFPSESLDTRPTQYIVWLRTLQQFRNKIRDYRGTEQPKLQDFIHFIDMHRNAGIRMQATTDIDHDETAITLLTAHKSKGMEFDEVYIIDAVDSVWGDSARSRSRNIQFPSNMPLAPAGDSGDERLRLLFVAATRARDSLLYMNYSTLDSGKETLPIAAISDAMPTINHETTAQDTIQAITTDWRGSVLDVTLSTKERVLQPLLERYKLSATHLNNFLNVPRGGPELFLLQNLLRFPQAMSPSAAFGSAIHATLQRAHTHMQTTGKKRPLEDILNDFESLLEDSQLSPHEQTLYSKRGADTLTVFLDSEYDTFTQGQVVERSFSGEDIMIGQARITGAIDLLDIDDKEKTIFITDYKTGKPSAKWFGKTDYEKIKLHHYEQQLMMYKLLIEGSTQFIGYTVTGGRLTFVEPDNTGAIIKLDYTYDSEKIAEFSQLLQAVWARIQSMNFELDTSYHESLTGIRDFERDLLQNS
ncbi:MAG: ATP-dependent DNA helicase [Candidatus Saccharimonadales bacterium]